MDNCIDKQSPIQRQLVDPKPSQAPTAERAEELCFEVRGILVGMPSNAKQEKVANEIPIESEEV